MSSDVREKLKAEILTGFWMDLQPHAERGALFVVDGDLDLVDVGVKISEDEVESIGRWLQSGELARPTLEQIRNWDAQASRSFRFLIVQPYVLIQEQAH